MLEAEKLNRITEVSAVRKPSPHQPARVLLCMKEEGEIWLINSSLAMVHAIKASKLCNYSM